MATVGCLIAATPEQVFAVLADGWSYSNWVVGTSHIRAVDRDWPKPGSRVHHASGIWPAVIRDETAVESVQPDHRLILKVKGWPMGEARVQIDLDRDGDATHVTLIETPVKGPGKWLHNPATEALLHRRNVEGLARLAALVERRASPSEND
jgi:uncharacterized protein YndB with AHSA1/START domain